VTSNEGNDRVDYRSLGRTDLRSSVIGFGCGRIASLTRIHRRREIMATLDEAFEMGINFFDTANSYGQGGSERLLGKVIRGRRLQAIICTKAGYLFGGMRRFVKMVKASRAFASRRSGSAHRASCVMCAPSPGQNFAAEYITASLEGSLRRLETDYVDLFLLHDPPRSVIAEGTALHAIERLQRRGLVRYYGVSCVNTQDALFCLEIPGISVLEVACNPFHPDILDGFLTRAARRSVAIIARSPFAHGRVLRDSRLQHSVTQDPLRTSAQTVLRAMMQLPGIDVVLAGMATRSHLVENVGAVAAPPLSPEEMARFCDLASAPKG
jgi:aryl-alcohol dehydrogenase-like predicted oxidoreductase